MANEGITVGPTGPRVRNERVREIISDEGADGEKRRLAQETIDLRAALKLMGFMGDLVRVVDEDGKSINCFLDEFEEINKRLEDDERRTLYAGDTVAIVTDAGARYRLELVEENVVRQ